ncbi:MAG TPA: hypothetical protein DEF41_08210 [Desulfovibrio sp.]|nr:hypothetical protein [Desulfovibrio sp.]
MLLFERTLNSASLASVRARNAISERLHSIAGVQMKKKPV